MFSTEVAQAINTLIEGVNVANKRGAFSLSEAAHLHSATQHIISESENYQKALEAQGLKDESGISPEEPLLEASVDLRNEALSSAEGDTLEQRATAAAGGSPKLKVKRAKA